MGYATINNISLNINGTVSSADNGIIKITNVSFVSGRSQNLNGTPTPSWTDDSITFDVSIYPKNKNDVENKEYIATFEVTIFNDSLKDNKITATNFNPTITTGNTNNITITYSLEDANGDIGLNSTIPAKSEAKFYVIINLYPTYTGLFNVTGTTTITMDETDEGLLIGSIPPNSVGDLRGNTTKALFSTSVLNTHNTNQTFTLSIANDRFELLDENENSFTSCNINANETRNFSFYIRRKNNIAFASGTQKLNVFIESSNHGKSSMGIVSLLVDPDPTLLDFDAPIISNVIGTINKEVGTIDVSWNGYDDVGIDHYVIELYKVVNNTTTLIETKTTIADETNITFTGVSDATHFFKVYGVDTSGNTANANEIAACSSNSGSCSKSANVFYNWHFTVTLNLTNANSSNGTSIATTYDGTVTTTLSGRTGYNRPKEITSATMGGNPLSGNAGANSPGYTYNSSNGNLEIRHITGNVVIKASGYSGGCFAKGTKVLLADKSYKNIEDIAYDDLLAVWNYDTGSLTYEYPLWIEKEHNTNRIIKISFSDNTSLDVVYNHAFYNTDLNLFVSVNDEKNFKIGTNIAKITKDGKFEKVKITNIKYIDKETTFYFVGSTSYYNIIANGKLTTDENVMISNLYGFNNKAKWPSIKDKIVSDKNNLLDYSYFEDILPKYLYEGFRVKEAGYLVNNKMIELDDFKDYISKLVINPDMILKPITKNNYNYWMVTTSEDNVTTKENYLIKEGSYYLLPLSKSQKFKGWYNTSDNKVYKPGDKIIVNHGLHFIALSY